jgi:hypothetical protein
MKVTINECLHGFWRFCESNIFSILVRRASRLPYVLWQRKATETPWERGCIFSYRIYTYIATQIWINLYSRVLGSRFPVVVFKWLNMNSITVEMLKCLFSEFKQAGNYQLYNVIHSHAIFVSACIHSSVYTKKRNLVAV